MEVNVKDQVETDWDLIPSDPDIFNDMLREYGINQMSIKEAYSVTLEEFMDSSPVYGIIYTSRYEEEQLPDNIEEDDADANMITFTSQVITNACATLALLAIVLNVDIERGDIINEFKNFTENFAPINRGIALGNSPQIRKIHNSYGVAEKRADEAMQNDALQSIDGTESLVEEDSFHFISYIVKNGFIWELDGMKARAIKLAAVVEEQHWLATLSPYLQHRMEDDIQCSILVATTNPLTEMKKSLEKYIDELQEVKDKLKEVNEDDTETMTESLLLQQQQQVEEKKNMLVDVESKKRKPNREDEEEKERQENKIDDDFQPLNRNQKKKQEISVEGGNIFKDTSVTVSTQLSSENISPSSPSSSSSSIMYSNDQQSMERKSSSPPLPATIPEDNIINIPSVSPLSAMSDYTSPSSSPLSLSNQSISSLKERKGRIINLINGLKSDIKSIETEAERDRLEMSRQKFDYFPFITSLISTIREHHVSNDSENTFSSSSPPLSSPPYPPPLNPKSRS